MKAFPVLIAVTLAATPCLAQSPAPVDDCKSAFEQFQARQPQDQNGLPLRNPLAEHAMRSDMVRASQAKEIIDLRAQVADLKARLGIK